jgi:hypothetical protein
MLDDFPVRGPYPYILQQLLCNNGSYIFWSLLACDFFLFIHSSKTFIFQKPVHIIANKERKLID